MQAGGCKTSPLTLRNISMDNKPRKLISPYLAEVLYEKGIDINNIIANYVAENKDDGTALRGIMPYLFIKAEANDDSAGTEFDQIIIKEIKKIGENDEPA